MEEATTSAFRDCVFNGSSNISVIDNCVETKIINLLKPSGFFTYH